MLCPEKLQPLITKPKRYKVVIGGRGSGKSMTFADICLMDAQTKGIKTACFREFQNSIDDSVLSLLAAEIDRLGLQGFEVQQNKVLYGGEEAFKFRGLARNPAGVQSMHGFKRFWVEEAQTTSVKSLRALTPTLREPGSEIWFSANPQSSADPFSQRFIKPFEKSLLKNGYYEDDLHLVILCNYYDNPFFPDVLEQDRLYDYDHLSTAEYNHIWLGAYSDEVDGSIIPVDWFNAAIDAHVKLGFEPLGAVIASHDPSDEGGDSKGFSLRQGSVILEACENETGDVNEGTDWALEKAVAANADYFVWDCDGLGVSLKRQVDQYLQGRKMQPVMFKGSEGVENPDALYQGGKPMKHVCKNKRAQYYMRLRDRFKATYYAIERGKYTDPSELISISSGIAEIDQLRAEICRVPRKKNSSLFQIMTKHEMLGMGISSPNIGDSVMMGEFIPDSMADFGPMQFSSGWN
jgi:phage terminase large subunit